MAGVMVFIPTGRASWREAIEATTSAHAPTPALLEAFDLAPGDDAREEAQYAALTVASVTALAHHGARFVLGAEVAPDQVDDSDDAGNGEVVVRGLRRAQIVSWFTDETPDHPAVRAAAAAARCMSTEAAWHLDEVQTLISEHALLWHAAEELEN